MKERFKLKNGNILEIIQDEDPMNPRTDWDPLGKMVCWHRRYNLGDNRITGKDARRNFKPLYEDSMEMFCDIAGLPHPDDIKNEQLRKVYDTYVRYVAHEKALILPLRLYDHSGITMSIGSGPSPFDPGGWDSGQVGWIFLTDEEARENWKVDENGMVEEWYGPNKGTKVPLREIMYRMLEGEVETYDQYLTGDVYGFKLFKVVQYEKTPVGGGETEIIEEEEEIDSCWGFYGHEHTESGLYEHAGITEMDIEKELD